MTIRRSNRRRATPLRTLRLGLWCASRSGRGRAGSRGRYGRRSTASRTAATEGRSGDSGSSLGSLRYCLKGGRPAIATSRRGSRSASRRPVSSFCSRRRRTACERPRVASSCGKVKTGGRTFCLSATYGLCRADGTFEAFCRCRSTGRLADAVCTASAKTIPSLCPAASAAVVGSPSRRRGRGTRRQSSRASRRRCPAVGR